MMDIKIPSDLKLIPSPTRKFIHIGRISKLQGTDLERYISDFGIEEKIQVRELWRTHAARKELIDFTASNNSRTVLMMGDGRVQDSIVIPRIQLNRAARQYGYNPDALTYYEQTRTGTRQIPQASIKLDINRFTLGIQTEQRRLMADMIAGKITPQQWYDETARLMKLSYRAAVDVARGTNEEMTDEEKERWLLLALLLFLLLNNMAEELESGELIINGRLPIAAGSRGGAVRSIYENWRLGQAVSQGYDEGRRVLNVAEHCTDSETRPGCVELAELGWVPIREVVPLGYATCGENDKCSLKFRKKQRRVT